MSPEPFQNRCRKRVVFQHRFFRVSASILEGLGPPTWSQVRRAACSARRVRPHSMDMCLEPPCMEVLGGAKSFQILDEMASCWDHVGTFFALGRLFFALGRFLCTFWALLAHLGRFFRFFGRSGLDFAGSRAGFGAFKPTYIFRSFWVLASTNHRSALHATKPQFLRCFIDFGTCRTQLPNVFFV